MSSSDPRGRGGMTVSREPEVRVLTIGGVVLEGRRVRLRDLGFVGYVSEPARAEIERNEARAARVVTTAARFAFR